MHIVMTLCLGRYKEKNMNDVEFKSKYNDYEILKQGSKYYVANYWDENQSFLGEFDSWDDAEAFIARIYGNKPWREIRRKAC